MSSNIIKKEARLFLKRHLVKEHKTFMVAMAAIHPDYMEGDPMCDKNIAHLATLEAEVARLEELSGYKKVNPLKESKRS